MSTTHSSRASLPGHHRDHERHLSLLCRRRAALDTRPRGRRVGEGLAASSVKQILLALAPYGTSCSSIQASTSARSRPRARWLMPRDRPCRERTGRPGVRRQDMTAAGGIGDAPGPKWSAHDGVGHAHDSALPSRWPVSAKVEVGGEMRAANGLSRSRRFWSSKGTGKSGNKTGRSE